MRKMSEFPIQYVDHGARSLEEEKLRSLELPGNVRKSGTALTCPLS